MALWELYTDTGESHDRIKTLLPEDRPPWRPCHPRQRWQLRNFWLAQSDAEQPERARGQTYRPTRDEVEAVNAAIHLRRPLLIEGPPGVGKSSLASSVAYQLRLGPVLRWPVNTRSTLNEGLYHYDAVARLQHVAARRTDGMSEEASPHQTRSRPGGVDYLRLGALGTALLPWEHPRVVLIDEFDKGDVDLPNDLLHLMEEGWFLIPELARLSGQREVLVQTADGSPVEGWPIVGGRVACRAFPIILITSNGERQFPAAFLRRCIRLHMKPPTGERLRQIFAAHFAGRPEELAKIDELVGWLIEEIQRTPLATDQLLNAVFLRTRGLLPDGLNSQEIQDWLRRRVLQPLGSPSP